MSCDPTIRRQPARVWPLKPGAARPAYFNFARAGEIQYGGELIVSATVTATRSDGGEVELTVGTPVVAVADTPLPDGTTAGDGDTVIVMLSLPDDAMAGVVYDLVCLATTDAATTPDTVLDQTGRVLVG